MKYSDNEDFFDHIEYSGLGNRLIQILLRLNIQRFSQLGKMTDRDILLLPNIGRNYLRTIREHLDR